eukprot:CAMPEP_0117427360 /NCGR_PEP_ID=MMETSP0758-20121206/7228_1 /TAXON_ID=63605 /ORGANISM="Percolomonas cosmopolitus, Strain AE-1 (ATCC 50343)" /LENGTH=215 /DNA_ID=CAMNT_0005212959 /DNA_START=174 /DNA_END=818 /DNA_ORIENTATION=+
MLKDEYLVNEFDAYVTIQKMIERQIFKYADSNVEHVPFEERKVYVPKSNEDSRKMYFLCCSMLFPMMDTFFFTVATLCKYLLNRQASKSFLITYVQKHIKSSYYHRQIRYFESCSTEAINSSILTLIRMKVIEAVRSPLSMEHEPILLTPNEHQNRENLFLDEDLLMTSSNAEHHASNKVSLKDQSSWFPGFFSKKGKKKSKNVKQEYQYDFMIT